MTKADGSKQLFDKEKVARTCMRMGATPQFAVEVAERVEREAYEGMPTSKVLQLIFRFMRKSKPGLGNLYDLRKGISLMASKPEFEEYVRILLSHYGYEVSSNQVLHGRCGEHEIDAIARRDGVTYLVEAKHHSSYHALTGLDESRIAWAILEDVSEGFQRGLTDFKIDKAVIVTNTRYSEHAIRYGSCKGIFQFGWNFPLNHGLESIISEKMLYPMSCVKDVAVEDRLKLVDSGIVLIRQLLSEDDRELSRKTGLSLAIVRDIKGKAQCGASALEYY